MAEPLAANLSEGDLRRMAAELSSMLRAIARNDEEIAERRHRITLAKTTLNAKVRPEARAFAAAEYVAREAAEARIPKSDDDLVELLNRHRRRRLTLDLEVRGRRELLQLVRTSGYVSRWAHARRPRPAAWRVGRERSPRRPARRRRYRSRSPSRLDESEHDHLGDIPPQRLRRDVERWQGGAA